MLGYVFALLAAVLETVKVGFSKQGLKKIDEYAVSWAVRFSALILLLPLLLVTKIPPLGKQFWPALGTELLLDTTSTVFYMKAIKLADISLVVPMVAFSPLFLLVSSPLLIGEFPSLLGLIGVLLIITGSYWLNISQGKKDFWAPFKALVKNPGSRLMLMVAFMWGLVGNFHKIGINNSSALFWTTASHIGMTLFLLPIMMKKSIKPMQQIASGWKLLIPIGWSSVIGFLFMMKSFELILVVYSTAIKRISILLSVLLGWLIFKEKGIKGRLIGASLMVLGIILITVYA